tara:strand:+ start:4915 stop:5112 length:198 start_codon:yes stop_codon:yes gene_type:complete
MKTMNSHLLFFVRRYYSFLGLNQNPSQEKILNLLRLPFRQMNIKEIGFEPIKAKASAFTMRRSTK